MATSFALLFLTRATPRLKPEPEKEKEEEPVVREERPVVKEEKPAPPVEKPREMKPATIQVVDRAEGPEAGDRRGPAAILLVLDCSSSMDAKVDGNKKYRVARDVIRGLVHDAPDSMQVGLRIFGHNDADTSEMVWPMGPLSAQRRQELETLLPKLKPYGRTPMVRALLDARHDLDGVRQPGGKYIILIGDGKETSGGRMESVRDAYRGADVELVLHVVGFDVQGKGMAEDRRQLQEAAKVTGGKYYDARNAKELADALRAATYVPRPTAFEILDARGEKVIRTGKVNDPPLQLPEGTYQIRLVGGGKPVAIQVVPGKPLTLTVDEIERPVR